VSSHFQKRKIVLFFHNLLICVFRSFVQSGVFGIDALMANNEHAEYNVWWRQAFRHARRYPDEPKWQCVLAVCYWWPRCGALQNNERAFEYFKQAADAGHLHAQYWLAHFYHNGIGVPHNERLALEIWHKAAEAGDAQAQHALGFAYSHGVQNHFGTIVEQDPKQALYWLEKAAAQGDPDAQARLPGLRAGKLLDGHEVVRPF
jgi:hypothetical protein